MLVIQALQRLRVSWDSPSPFPSLFFLSSIPLVQAGLPKVARIVPGPTKEMILLKFLNIYFVYECFVYMYKYTTCMPGVFGGLDGCKLQTFGGAVSAPNF